MTGVSGVLSSYGATPPATLAYYLDASAQGAFPGASITTSASFDGTSQYLSASNAAFAFTGNFTVEGWYRPTNVTGTHTLFTLGPDPDNRYVFYLDGTSVASNLYGFGSTTYTSTVPINTWTHIAVVRSGSTVSVYINGTASATTDTQAGTLGNGTLNIGADATGGALFVGMMSNFRITNTAVYTGTFSTPTKALLPVSGTVVLLPLTTTPFVDISSYGATVTNNGTTATTASAPSITGPTTDLTGTYTLTITNAAPSITWSSGSGGVFNKTGSNTTDLIKGGPNYTSSSQSYTVFLAYQLQPVSASVGNGRILATASEATNDWLLGSYAPGTPNSPMYFNSFYPNADMGYNVDAYDTGWRFIWGTYNGTTGVSTKFIASSTVNNTSGPSSAYKTSSLGVGSHGFNQLRLWNRSASSEPATGNIGFVKVYNGVCSISQIQSQWSAYHSRFGI